MGGGEHKRCNMMYTEYPKHDPIKNFFPMPNEIFSLGLG